MMDQATFISFHWPALYRVREVAPDARLGFLSAERPWRNNVQLGRPGVSPWIKALDIDDLGRGPLPTVDGEPQRHPGVVRHQRPFDLGEHDEPPVGLRRELPRPLVEASGQVEGPVEAIVDGNFVATGTGRLIEVQMSAEGATFSTDEMAKLLELANAGIGQLVEAQKAATA